MSAKSKLASLLSDPPAVFIAAGAIVGAAVLWSAAPLVVGGIAEAYWLIYSAATGRAERAASKQAAEDERRRLIAALSADDREAHGAIRARVADAIRAAQERPDVGGPLEVDVAQKLSTLADSFLRLLAARGTYERFLAGADEHDLRRRLDRLRESGDTDTAELRTRHAAVLEHQLKLLDGIRVRDKKAAAQLDMIADAVELVCGQLAAARVEPGEVSSCMEAAVEGARQTQEFIEELSPLMGSVLDEGMRAT